MRHVAILAACAALGACQTPALIPTSDTLAVVQGDTSVDLAYNTVAQIYLSALPTMPASTKATVKPILAQAYAAVQAADNAEKLGDATTLTTQVQAAEALIAQAKQDLGK